MVFYYHSWMFNNHFIATLYHFLGLTYWPSAWCVSNISIIFYFSMMLYYHSWMFYNHFIVILYHFMVPTYWHSAKCQLLFSACFLHRRKSIPNGVQTQWNFLWNFLDQKTSSGPEKHLGGCSEGSTTHQGAPGGPGAPWWVVPTSGAPRTASLLYEYPNIPETLGSRRKSIIAATSSRTTRSNQDTITEGFITSIGASLMMRE